jgi:hypothetical protein
LLVLSVFISLTSLLVVGYLLDLGQNFVDLIPADDSPTRVKVGENLAGASLTSKSQATTILPDASIVETVPYVEYVPRLVPQAPCSVNKRTRADDASTSVSVTKKPHQLSTHLGTQVVGSMLLGEHFNIFCLLCCLFMSLAGYFLYSQMVLWLSCSRARRMKMMMRPSTHVGELLYCFVLLLLFLCTFSDLSLSFSLALSGCLA